MGNLDMSKYGTIDEIVSDIKSVKIQGATNIAIATFEGIKMFARNYDRRNENYDQFMEDLKRVGYQLAYARANEPLAKNGLKFITRMLVIRNPGLRDVEECRQKVTELCDEFMNIGTGIQDKIVRCSEEVLGDAKGVFTHCHSSTVVRILQNHAKKQKDFKVVCTETRPLMQGRTTATRLNESGIDTTLVVDSAAETIIIDDSHYPIDMVFLGADEITMRGDAINKIGSWGIALSSYFMSKPVYIVTPILKIEVETAYRPVEIEYRCNSYDKNNSKVCTISDEVWSDAPKGLKIVNPAFEKVNREFIKGYITELGVIRPENIGSVVQQNFQWLF